MGEVITKQTQVHYRILLIYLKYVLLYEIPHHKSLLARFSYQHFVKYFPAITLRGNYVLCSFFPADEDESDRLKQNKLIPGEAVSQTFLANISKAEKLKSISICGMARVREKSIHVANIILYHHVALLYKGKGNHVPTPVFNGYLLHHDRAHMCCVGGENFCLVVKASHQ